MLDSLVTYINRHLSAPLSDKDIVLVKKAFTYRRIKKRQFLLQEKDVCKHFAFIVKGAMRQYSIDDKGLEHIVALAIENWWAGDRESYIMLSPSQYNIDAWEDTDALLITRVDQLNLWQAVPRLNELSLKLDERQSIANQTRLNDLVSQPAEKRYAHFVEMHPEFLQRFPQHVIASYLGIAKETLSRLRSQMRDQRS